MQTTDIFKIIRSDIHSTVIATVDNNGLPVTCVIDIMDYDSDGLYFLTAKGKRFYDRLKAQGYLSLTGLKGEDTMHSVSVTVCGKVREIGQERLNRLFELNPYMNKIYPDEVSCGALTVFQIYEGVGELFDLSQKPIVRQSFSFGGAVNKATGYRINDRCIGCGECLAVCPQKCIDITVIPAVINQVNCLHCGNCLRDCPVEAVEKRS